MKSFYQFLNEEKIIDRELIIFLTSVADNNWRVNDDFSIDVNGGVSFYDERHSLIRIPIKFNKVNGYDTNWCSKLISLENSPQYVNGNFSCSDCDSLINLKGAPLLVNGYVNIRACGNLESLEGCPSFIGEKLFIHDLPHLKTLMNEPKNLKGDLEFDRKSRNSLPKEELQLDNYEIKMWWASGLTLEKFKEKCKGAIKLGKYNI